MKIRKRTWTRQGEKKTAWRVDWKTPGGRRMQKQFRSRNEAQLFLEKLVKDKHARTYGVLLDPITFEAFLPTYVAKKVWKTETSRERTSWSLQALRPFNDVLLPDITPEAIEEYRDRRLTEVGGDRTKPVSAATVRQELATLSDILKMAVKLWYLAENPMVKVERPALPVKQDDPADFLPPADLEKLIGAAGRDACLYEFAAATGLRASELLAVEWPDIRDGVVVVRRGKGRKQRIVPLIAEAIAALQKAPRKLNEPRVFWWIHDRSQLYKRFKRRTRWAGLNPGYDVHALRHTYASYAIMAGMNTHVVAKNLGHADTTVTRRYGHLAPDFQREESRKLSPFWKRGTTTVQDAAKSAEN